MMTLNYNSQSHRKRKRKNTACIWMMTLNYKCTKSQKKNPRYMDDDFKLQMYKVTEKEKTPHIYG